MLVGEDMPDKNDPKYKKRYEKEVAAGRKFGAVLRSSDGGCKCHRAAGRAHEADDECRPLHHSSRDASNQRGESRQVSNIKIRQR